MKKLPFLISVPHAGLMIPSEIRENCILTQSEIIEDGDVGAWDIYGDLKSRVESFITTDIARAIIDLNRPANDIGGDGVVKSHTCWGQQVYKTFPSEVEIDQLLDRYYYPYHSKLSALSENKYLALAIDCHTMSQNAPPVSPEPGKERPLICLSNGNGSCPKEWINGMAEIMKEVFQNEVLINDPFKGGHITLFHGNEMPWMQLEVSRTTLITNSRKSASILEALKTWSDKFIF